MVITDEERELFNQKSEETLNNIRRRLAYTFIQMKNEPELHRIMSNYNYRSFLDIIANDSREFGDKNLYDFFIDEMNTTIDKEPYHDGDMYDPTRTTTQPIIAISVQPSLQTTKKQQSTSFLQSLKSLLH